MMIQINILRAGGGGRSCWLLRVGIVEKISIAAGKKITYINHKNNEKKNYQL